MRTHFFKLSAAGNDFILLPGAPRRGRAALARRLCDRRRGIGADGLILMKRGRAAAMSYFNADGSSAFCGNGSRAAARWLYDQNWTRGRKEFSLKTASGFVSALITGAGRAAIRMPEPRAIRLGLKIRVLGRSYTAHHINTGVPHAVIEVRGLENLPVKEIGRAIRRHKIFAPQGVNVDFIRIRPGALEIRTYERGVEDETLACGTGSTASALVAFLLGKRRPPVKIKVRGGDILTVNFKPGFKDIWLEGPAQLVYTGQINL